MGVVASGGSIERGRGVRGSVGLWRLHGSVTIRKVALATTKVPNIKKNMN